MVRMAFFEINSLILLANSLGQHGLLLQYCVNSNYLAIMVEFKALSP